MKLFVQIISLKLAQVTFRELVSSLLQEILKVYHE